MERLPAAVGRGGLRRHQRAEAAARQGLETGHRALQQVSRTSIEYLDCKTKCWNHVEYKYEAVQQVNNLQIVVVSAINC